ncbi:5'/3'-nucleotidase SurE [Actinoplanes solisilvae]|uniref:5'/3'-nucleotidase SurE n=1 Tax=Actinoplanes solisilvae TaxID=2486853 RepID=UPI000FDB166C|nr:5'/3'-nucleotidase SurE [Actinoplanes solisilvae]
MTRILVTNDDGIDAPGLRWLARAAAREGHEVVVAAPVTEASGSSAAMTAVEEHGKIILHKRELPHAKHIPAYAVAASPAYIVLLALREAFGEPPEMIFSGINRGANAGAAVVHSGTVGATLTGSYAGLHGLAVSLDVLSPRAGTARSGGAALAALDHEEDEKRHWGSAAELAVRLVPTLLHTPVGTIFNLNVPDLHLDGIRGLRRASLAQFGQVQVSIVEEGEGFVRTAVQAADDTLQPDTDLAALAEHFAVVTPIRPPHEMTEVKINLEAVPVHASALQ